MLIPIVFSASYILSCFGVASIAENKKVGAQRTFHIAVLFTPLIALLVVAFSPKTPEVKVKLVKCRRCGYEFPDQYLSCPACAKEGKNILANETSNPKVLIK
ncbi:MAG: hypothetical protein Q8908_00450 [Bacteroidota bacterium]|nr:hypothetical protein [Bacteroidota bacterium]